MNVYGNHDIYTHYLLDKNYMEINLLNLYIFNILACNTLLFSSNSHLSEHFLVTTTISCILITHVQEMNIHIVIHYPSKLKGHEQAQTKL
jgi:hypothetical protein